MNMLKVYRDNEGAFCSGQLGPSQIIWIDVLNPTDAEKQIVAERVGIQIPSVAALSEIETSSRLPTRFNSSLGPAKATFPPACA